MDSQDIADIYHRVDLFDHEPGHVDFWIALFCYGLYGAEISSVDVVGTSFDNGSGNVGEDIQFGKVQLCDCTDHSVWYVDTEIVCWRDRHAAAAVLLLE